MINKNSNSNAPGKDGINIELVECGGERLIEYVFELIKQIWREEKTEPTRIQKLERHNTTKYSLQNNNNTTKIEKKADKLMEALKELGVTEKLKMIMKDSKIIITIQKEK